MAHSTLSSSAPRYSALPDSAPRYSTLPNSAPRYSNEDRPVNNEHIDVASPYNVPSVFSNVLRSHQPAPGYSRHHIPTASHQLPPPGPTPLPQYHSQSAPAFEFVSDSEDEEGSIVEVSGAALVAHHVCCSLPLKRCALT